MNKFEWQSKNKIYDHEISIISAACNQWKYEMRTAKEEHEENMPLLVQKQIDSTLKTVLGDRKKYMKLLKSHQKTFYEKTAGDGGSSSHSQSGVEMDEAGNRVISPKSRKTTTGLVKIELNSNDTDSDNSIDRMQGMLQELQNKGKLNLGVGGISGGLVMGDGSAPISSNDLLNVLSAHDEKKYD